MDEKNLLCDGDLYGFLVGATSRRSYFGRCGRGGFGRHGVAAQCPEGRHQHEDGNRQKCPTDQTTS